MQQSATCLSQPATEWLLDDARGPGLRASNGAVWGIDTDATSGGESQAQLRRTEYCGESCLSFTGEVSLHGRGGFARMVLNLAPGFDSLDAAGFYGVRLSMAGNAHAYFIELQTADTVHRWQCYRAPLVALPKWQTIHFPFTAFEGYRVMCPLAVTQLRRLSVAAVGRPMAVDVYVHSVSFYAAGS